MREDNDKLDAEVMQAEIDHCVQKGKDELAEVDAKRMQSARREVELSRIAGDLPDDINALWMFTEHSMMQEAVSGIDVGRGLLKLKEKLPHGEFMEGLKERGLPARTARRKMAIAVRFADRSEKLLKLGRTKLYACLDFSDDDLNALEDGESILDMDLDKIDRMTTRELKAAIKKRDADLEVKNQLLEAKNKQIDDIAEENAVLRGGAKESESNPFVQEVEHEKAQILIPLIRLKNRALMMESKLNETGAVDRAEYFAMQRALDTLRDEMAQAMDAIFNAGSQFQASIASASLPSDDTYAGMN